MARLLYVRVAGAIVLCSILFLLVSLDPFLRAAPIGPGIGEQTPAVSVNRFRKGNLLPIHHSSAVWQDFRRPDGLQTERHVPLGCDPAFSPVATPSLSTVFGRCMA
jgi:hypothetical protein